MPARNLRHDRARCIRFRDDPSLILVAPPPPATDATANLDASARRGSVNYMVDHICEPILSTRFASSALCRPPQDGGKTPLTVQRGDLPKIEITREGGIWYNPRSAIKGAVGVLYPDMSKMTTFEARY